VIPCRARNAFKDEKKMLSVMGRLKMLRSILGFALVNHAYLLYCRTTMTTGSQLSADDNAG
jgi:hypothetical protein